MAVTYRTLDICAICERRPEDCTVVIEGRVTPICDTCYQRAEDERHRFDEGDDDA